METVEIEFEGVYFTVEIINDEISKVTTDADIRWLLKIQDFSKIKKIAQDKRFEDLTAEHNE